MDMVLNPSLTSEDISELRRILGVEIERTKLQLHRMEDQMKLEEFIRTRLLKMRDEILEQEQAFDKTIDNSIAAVHRARTRHPSEMARMPWITD